MQRRVLVNFAVTVACGAVIGVAVAGLPQKSADDVRITAAQASALDSTTTTTLPLDVPVSVPVTASTLIEGSTGASDETTASDGTSGSATGDVSGTVTTEPSTTTSASPPTTTIPETTTTVPARSEVRVLVANAADRRGVAAAASERVRGLGYPLVSATDALVVQPNTLIVAAEQYVPSARQLITDLGLSQDILRLRGADAITTDDNQGDVIMVLGEDWVG